MSYLVTYETDAHETWPKCKLKVRIKPHENSRWEFVRKNWREKRKRNLILLPCYIFMMVVDFFKFYIFDTCHFPRDNLSESCKSLRCSSFEDMSSFPLITQIAESRWVLALRDSFGEFSRE